MRIPVAREALRLREVIGKERADSNNFPGPPEPRRQNSSPACRNGPLPTASELSDSVLDECASTLPICAA